jgi:hypothetical protein
MTPGWLATNFLANSDALRTPIAAMAARPTESYGFLHSDNGPYHQVRADPSCRWYDRNRDDSGAAIVALMTRPLAQDDSAPREKSVAAPRRGLAAVETGLIFLVLFLWGGGPPPDTNEAHYLAKARHYWDPEWCPGDFFLESADAHLVFYWTFGWVAALLPLPAAAWVGRIAMWALQAWSWRRLSWAVVPRPMFSLLSAALFLVLLDWCELAGEWIADGVEAKSFAFGFVFLGIEAIVRNRWRLGLVLFGAASAFHVLVGGWSVVAAGFAWLGAGQERPRLREISPALLGGFLLSLPGLLPGLALTRGFDPATVAEANQIYVFVRLPHHLLPSHFPAEKYAAYASLLATFLALGFATLRLGQIEAGLRRLWGLAGGAVLIGMAGMAFFLATKNNPELAANLLRFYFFRLSDAFLPLAAALTLGVLLVRLQTRRPRLAAAMLIAGVMVAVAGVGHRYLDRRLDFRPGADRQSLPRFADPRETEAAYHAWRRMGAWVQSNTPSDALFLTPRAQQTFKWYAHRPEVVTWKDLPQDAAGIVEWRRRFTKIYAPVGSRGLTASSDAELLDLAREYGVKYIVIERNQATRRPGFERVYPEASFENLHYEVYRL